MEIAQFVKNKFSSLKNRKRLLSLINSNILMQIIALYTAKQSIGSREYLLNGVSDEVINNINSAKDFKNSSVLPTFVHGFIFLVITWIVLFLLLHFIQHFIESINYQYTLLLINVTIWGLVNVYKVQGNIIFTIILSAVVLSVYYYVFIKKKLFNFEEFEISRRKSVILLITAFSCYVLLIGGLTVLRYLDYKQNIYDTSIFSQMYYYLSKWGLPYTTVERGKLLSHFAVHFSPIYYILLPGYMLFSSPVFLAIAKTLLLASGVFPLYKTCRHRGLSNICSIMLSVSYLLFPFLIASNIGDGDGHILNENYFYPALLFWIFYFIEVERFKPMWIFCIMTLLVKEDAPIILACIGLYLILYRKSNFHGKILFVLSAVYFFAVTKFIIPQFGEQYLIASYYNNFVPDSSLAFPAILYALIFKPSYVIQQIFTPGKLIFLCQLLIPLLLLPLQSLKKVRNLILVIPIVLTSLLCINPSYIYATASHHNMAPICICFYLTVLMLSEIKSKRRRFFLVLSILLVTSIFSTSYNIDKTKYLSYYIENRDSIKLIDSALSKIPEDVSVTATDGFSTKLTKRFTLTNFFNPSCDYAVIDMSNIGGNNKKTVQTLLKGNEYGVSDYKKNLYLILIKNYSTERNLSVYNDQFGE
ncbi:MAG: DUF2079 domain-containing protein [Bacillota bacterium]|nr:DUF2079 domain-containing protein [Bacillota bacterium]